MILPSFLKKKNVHKALWSKIKMIADSLISRNIFDVNIPIISYSNINILFFSDLTPLRCNIFPISYPITKNEFGRTAERGLEQPTRDLKGRSKGYGDSFQA